MNNFQVHQGALEEANGESVGIAGREHGARTSLFCFPFLRSLSWKSNGITDSLKENTSNRSKRLMKTFLKINLIISVTASGVCILYHRLEQVYVCVEGKYYIKQIFNCSTNSKPLIN